MLGIFAKNPEAYYNGKFLKFTEIEDLKCLKCLTTLFEMRHKASLMKLIGIMSDLKSKKVSSYDIMMFHVSD